jgi:hypothetical protein
VLKKVFNALLVDLTTGVEMICVLLVSAIFAKKYSMFATVPQSINIGVVFAENLKIVLDLSNLGFDNIINFDWHRLLSIN